MNNENPYGTPDSVLPAGSQADRVVQELRHKQNGIAAIVVGAATALLVAILWHEVTKENRAMSPVFMVAAGAIVGLAVRLVGRGVTTAFQASAVVLHFLCAFFAILVFGAPFLSDSTTPAAVFLLLLGVGAALAYKLSHRSIAPEQKSLLWRHDKNLVPAPVRLRNRWWVILITGALCLTTMLALAGAWIVLGPQ